MTKPNIFTVGHSNHTIDYFTDLIEAFKINCIIDVRSVAASNYNPQYNEEPLSNALKAKEIEYLHFADEFGARHTDPDLLDESGQVNFERVRKTKDFKRGVERLWQGVKKGYNMALMCSESDPVECHRFSMISKALDEAGFDVRHIMKDKTLKLNSDLEMEILRKYNKKLPKPDMFNPCITKEDQLLEAYRLLNKAIGFSPKISKQLEEHYD